MAVMEGEHDHHGETDGHGQGKRDQAIKKHEARTLGGRVLRIIAGGGRRARRITHL